MNAADQERRPESEGSVRSEWQARVDEGGLRGLRSAVSAHAADWGLPEAITDRLVAVATELATNAIRYGGGSGQVRLWRDGRTIGCQVSDHGPGMTDPETAGLAEVPLSADHGRGLWLVRQFCDHVSIDTGEGATIVNATMSIS